ncbi:FAD-dependent oxidoreductase [Ferrimicrobium acidiphilum]|uniref:FAD-dependent oxidoreductase n=3 Tax=Ferrimicrobium acidiphilum TaxID=121039 RepID=UPI0009DF6A6F|nr:FAD-dependent oxidoreductase [Ferrimicrobium acidiphilum]
MNSSEFPQVTVLKDRCSGCQECLVRCPVEAITLDEFTYTVNVDESICVACRQCERTCPFAAIHVEGSLRVSDRVGAHLFEPADVRADLHEVRVGFLSDDELVAEANRCLNCPDPTCVRGCPTHNDIPAFIERARNLDFAGAREILSASSSMPEICSRVCDTGTQCEGACSFALAGDMPVAIHEIERYLADRSEPKAATSEPVGISVAVIGGGPAGIGVADVIARGGGQATIFEASSKIGGLLRSGIPEFTLPDAVVSRVASQLEGLGVEIVTNTRVSLETLEDLSHSYDAVVIAQGANAPLPITAAGKESVKVTEANEFLAHAYQTIRQSSGDANIINGPHDVLVVGAGNTAMDVARMTRRLGGNATCVDWMDRRFSLVRPDELGEAEHEGVEVLFSVTVASLRPLPNGRIAATLVATVQEERAQRPKVTDKVFRVMEVDEVVAALGYRLEPELLASFPSLPVRKEVPVIKDRHWVASGIFNGLENEISRRMPVGDLSVGRERARSRAQIALGDRVYVVGDSLIGPSTVVEAMAQGRKLGKSLLSRSSRHAPSSAGRLRPPRVLISIDSPGGTTRALAMRLAELLSMVTNEIVAVPVDQVTPELVADYDLLILATWVDGMVVGGQHASAATQQLVGQLLPGSSTDVAVLLTYGFDPGHALDRLANAVTGRGYEVVAQCAMKSHADGLFQFVRDLCGAAWPDVDAAGLLKMMLDTNEVHPDDIGKTIGIRPDLAAAVARSINEVRALQGGSGLTANAMNTINELQAAIDSWRRGDSPRQQSYRASVEV